MCKPLLNTSGAVFNSCTPRLQKRLCTTVGNPETPEHFNPMDCDHTLWEASVVCRRMSTRFGFTLGATCICRVCVLVISVRGTVYASSKEGELCPLSCTVVP